jgi:hypothetical protein
MKRFSFLVLLAVLFVSNYALAQIPSCPCDNLELKNGTIGNDIVEILCPGGELGEGANYELTADRVSIRNESLSYGVFDQDPPFEDVCVIFEGIEGNGANIEQQVEDCRQRLIQGCNLKIINPIPTLSEWGLIAMAGLMGIVGFIVMRRRKIAA